MNREQLIACTQKKVECNRINAAIVDVDNMTNALLRGHVPKLSIACNGIVLDVYPAQAIPMLQQLGKEYMAAYSQKIHELEHIQQTIAQENGV